MAKTEPQITTSEFLTDPFGSLARAREGGWLVDIEFARAVIGYRHVRELLADDRLHANFPDFLRSIGITSGAFFEWMALSPLNRDGEDHRRWRSLMTRTFTPRRVEGIRPFLREAANELVDGFADRGRCEFVAEFADAYPSLGLCELIGVPAADRERFRGWANTIGLGFSLTQLSARIAEVDAALEQLLAYAGELAAARRAEPRDDLVTRIACEGHDEGWTDDEIRGAIAGLVFAGHETTKNQLGWTIAVLSERADVWDGVAAGSIEASAVVDEVLRYRSAATGVGRTVVETVEREGEKLEPGERLVLSLWGADHDPAAFSTPERVDVAHNGQAPHVAFGHGAHFCLGASLARAEIEEALAVLATRIECPRLDDGATWSPPIGINGPATLPISFAKRRAAPGNPARRGVR
jgi:cytochrome P450